MGLHFFFFVDISHADAHLTSWVMPHVPYYSCAMAGWSAEHTTTFWDRWDMDTVMHYPVSQRRKDLLENQRDENLVKTPMRSIGRPSRANMTLLIPPQSPSSIRKKCAICNSVVDTKAGHTVLNARNWKLENSSQPLEGRLPRPCTTPVNVA